MEIGDLKNSDYGKYLKNQITFYPKNNFICIVKLSDQDYITLFINCYLIFKCLRN